MDATAWTGTLDNLDCDDEAAAAAGIDTSAWPARVIEDGDGRVRLQIAASGDAAAPVDWIAPSRFRDCQPAIPADVEARLLAAGEIDAPRR